MSKIRPTSDPLLLVPAPLASGSTSRKYQQANPSTPSNFSGANVLPSKIHKPNTRIIRTSSLTSNPFPLKTPLAQKNLANRLRALIDKKIAKIDGPSTSSENKSFLKKVESKWNRITKSSFSIFFNNPNIEVMFTHEANLVLSQVLNSSTYEEKMLLNNLKHELNALILARLIRKNHSQESLRRVTIEQYLNYFNLTHSKDLLDHGRITIKVRGESKNESQTISPDEIFDRTDSDKDISSALITPNDFLDNKAFDHLTQEEKTTISLDQILMGVRESLESYPEEFVATMLFGLHDSMPDEYELSKWNTILIKLHPSESAVILSNLQNDKGTPNINRVKNIISTVLKQYPDDVFTLQRILTILSYFPLSTERKISLNRVTLDHILKALLEDPKTEKFGLQILQKSQYLTTKTNKSIRFYNAFHLFENPTDWYDSLFEIITRSKLRPKDLPYDIGYREGSPENKVLNELQRLNKYYKPKNNKSFLIDIDPLEGQIRRFQKVLNSNFKLIPEEIREHIVLSILEIIDIIDSHYYQNIQHEKKHQTDFNKDLLASKKRLVPILKLLQRNVHGELKVNLQETIFYYEEPSRRNQSLIYIYRNNPDKLKAFLNDKNAQKAKLSLDRLIELKVDLSDCDLSRFKLTHYEFADIRINGLTARQIVLDKGNLSGSTIIDADFSNMRLSHVDFSNCEMLNANFSNSTIENCHFNHASLDYSNFKNTEFVEILITTGSFFSTNFQGANFSNCIFRNINFEKSDFSDSHFFAKNKFEQCKLGGSDFHSSQLQKVIFHKAQLEQVRQYFYK